MNTKRAGALSQRRRQVAEGIKAVSAVQDTVVAGMDEESRKNFLAGRPCKPEKLTEDAKKIIETYGHNVVDKFFLLKSDKDVLRTLNDAEIGKPIIMMYPNRSAHMWQLMYFVVQKTEKENKITILFKDPAGNDIAQNLEKEIKKSFENVEIITNTQKQLNKNQMYAYGPVTLENIKTLINFLNKHRQWLEFTDENFLKLKDMQQDYLKAVIELTTELKENDKFLIALKKFLNDIPVALVPLVNKYTETLQGMSEEDDDDLKCEEISNNRNELFSKGMVTNLKHQFKNMSIDSENEFKLEIQKNFPKEMTKLNEIFEILDNVKIDKEFFEALKIISQALQLDFEKLKSFYESRIRAKEDEAENIIKSDAIDEIAKQLPEPKQSSCTDCSPLHELMAEIVIGKDGEDSEESDKNDLTDKYMAIVEKYESWKNATIYDINDWAKNHKGNLGATEDDIIEAVAVMDRAFHLVTGGFQLRAPQILSVLVFLHNQQNAGRLCQIKTGEGKTVIVSLLAVIKCLQGHRVDVLTTNPLLAAEGVTETKRFYSVFGISVATNNKGSDGSINPSCYTADVLYGTITNFQFDHLKDSLGESNTRRGRHFDVVILDEVDSMLIDNGGHIAKLASPYPGMEYLRYVYINIWAALQRADAEYAKESKQEIKEIILNNPIEEAQIQYDSCLEKRSVNKYKAIKKIISATDPTNIPFLPKHLRDYAASQLDTWLTNALHAKYECHEHIQYRLITDENGGKKVVPIDYQNTGVTMTKTIWSKGLHQFVQIKHNIELTYETLTSSYISNLGYVNMYKDVNIYGMTGTLGSEAEQDLLSKIYKIDFAKIPTFRAKQFRELPGTVVEDDDWAERVAVEILSFVDQGRAALVVCESEEDLMAVEQNLQLLKDDEFRVRFYYREEHADETTEKVKVGDVILATNIAGRGTNFKTDKVVEGNGGLHVIVGFLPCNLRVEGQAFGRTSRQGNNGSAQLVIRRREVNELLPEIREDVSFEEVKALRDSAEFKRLEKIGNEFVKELNFKDTLYGLFADFYRKETQFAASEEYEYVRKDLKELWAFWLEKKHFTAKNITIDPSAVFDEFKQKAKTIIDGEISHNAYYAIGVADYYLGHGNFEEAQKFVERAIEISGDMNIAGAYLKKFEAFFETGSSFLERLNEILKKYLHINFFDIKSIDLSVVQSSLKKARSHIENEVEYVKGLMEDSNLATILLPEEGENHFLKHLRSGRVV
ncbi:hypothetical protein Zmor_004630 [Zophobas morio]|uniref:Protein translocase subunit SecA n=1 Tax=Zophobas morio TaxID=2755281 RepID=A0AA38IUM9_9CUCU|nr:hypothetical protein Zmor_004630 [Zophobas morio]